jgi:thiamine biosynthesis lipoprotein
MKHAPKMEKYAHGWRGRFTAMSSPCEVLVRDLPGRQARAVTSVVVEEALRIEQKFSRYRDDNIVARINAGNGEWVEVDEETERLLDYADTCWQLSDGLFDITSGVLRRAWKFDGSDRVPTDEAVAKVLPLVGWKNIERRTRALRLTPGMELDFGGIGKEYAVDRALALARQQAPGTPLLVNFGGDIAAWCGDAAAWVVGLEGLTAGAVAGRFELRNGGLATSGDSRRYLLRDGVRYSHVLNPVTGWPVMDGPHSVTVAAAQCTLAGMLATLALLRGADAENFLRAQQVPHWCLWGEHRHETVVG